MLSHIRLETRPGVDFKDPAIDPQFHDCATAMDDLHVLLARLPGFGGMLSLGEKDPRSNGRPRIVLTSEEPIDLPALASALKRTRYRIEGLPELRSEEE